MKVKNYQQLQDCEVNSKYVSALSCITIYNINTTLGDTYLLLGSF